MMRTISNRLLRLVSIVFSSFFLFKSFTAHPSLGLELEQPIGREAEGEQDQVPSHHGDDDDAGHHGDDDDDDGHQGDDGAGDHEIICDQPQKYGGYNSG